MSKSHAPVLVLTLTMLLIGPAAMGQLRTVSYNVLEDGFNGSLNYGTETVLEAIGNESRNGIARPADLLILQEVDYGYGAANAIVDAMNDLYGAGTYARASQDPYGYQMPVNIVYNTTTLVLEHTKYFKYSTSPRKTGRYRLGVVGYDDLDLYVYNTHYKASTGASNENKRADEAWNIRTDADSLAEDALIIYAGDFNQRSSWDDGYNDFPSLRENPYEIIKAGSMPQGTSGNGQGVDPIHRPGAWHESYSFRDIHTQAPTASFGGVDDRFDFQMVSTELNDGEGLSYIGPNAGDSPAAVESYRAFGNNGTHNLNGDISSGTGASWQVLQALETASDHLPVVMDLQLPAVMDVSLDVPALVIRQGRDASVGVTVTNAAPVAVALGADELDYQVIAGGDLSGGASGTDPALGGGNQHVLELVTDTPGDKLGTVYVTSSSQDAANASFQQQVSYTVTLLGDVDTDGDLAVADIDADDINACFDRAGSADVFGDLNDSGLVDGADVDLLVEGILATYYGDATLDGEVGISDLGVLAGGWGQSFGSAAWEKGDFDGDGEVGVSDLGILAGTWGSGAGVPEPASLLLMAGAAVAGLAGRRRG